MKIFDIRPKELYQRYLELSLEDASHFNQEEYKAIACPGCKDTNAVPMFQKNGFDYVRCQSCASLYCSPRPGEEVLTNFYENSPSSNYWSNIFYPEVAEIRREKLFRKKAQQIKAHLQKAGVNPRKICDVGAGFGIFLEELRPCFPEAELYAIEPGQELAQRCREKGFATLERTSIEAKEWAGRFDLVLSSEVLEHVFSPAQFVASLLCLTSKGGRCLVTGLGYEGFDILTLQQDSISVFPPHHLNFLSVKGLETLFLGAGFQAVDIRTPGVLDFDLVHSSGLGGEFARVLHSRGEEAIAEFQAFLQKYKMSSHVWCWATAP
ncbi:class I SAM-dependent methyltransferase [Deltaproteobacteria bacterium TL4]